MSLRVRSVLELPAAMRDQVRARLALVKANPAEAAEQLRLERLREERERFQLALLKQLEYVNLAQLFVREHRFHVERLWRLDLYCDSHKLGVELHGGIFAHGRHVRPAGFQNDRRKMNAAVELGIRVLEYWPQAIADGSACAQVERIIRSAIPNQTAGAVAW